MDVQNTSSDHQCNLVGDLDETDEDDKNEQVVDDADSPDDDVDDLECKVTDVGQIQRQIIVIFRR